MMIIKILFLMMAFVHFICTAIDNLFGIKRTYHLSFTKEANGLWYIDFPCWPFEHNNLMMVAGADDLCDELSDDGNHVKVKVIVSSKTLDIPRANSVRCDRQWAYLKFGGQYEILNFNKVKTKSIWLCQVTLFVLGWWPKYIYIIKEESGK